MTVFAAIEDLFKSFYELLASAIGTVYSLIHGILLAIVNFFSGLVNLVTDVFSGAVDVVGGIGKFVTGRLYSTEHMKVRKSR